MKRALLLAAIFAAFEAGGAAQSPRPNAHPAHTALPAQPPRVAEAAAMAKASFAQLPLAFERNQGQTDSHVRFLSRGAGYEIFLTPGETVLALSNGAADIPCTPRLKAAGEPCLNPGDQPRAQGAYLGLKMLGANPSTTVTGADELPGKTNYFFGNDPKKWHTSVSNFGKVRYQNLYPGIDLIYYGNHQQLESDFILSPGADPKKIRFEVEGARHMRVDAQGALVLETAVGDVRLLHPGIYQRVNGARRHVPGKYVLLSENRVGFEVAPYDNSQPLVIDPTLIYSTLLGGSSTLGDQAFGIAVDSGGNAYVTGRESSADFPGSGIFHVDQFQFIQFNRSIFVTKFNPTGSALLYSTLINGASSAASGSGFGIALDSTGAAYIVGDTNAADFPTVNPFQATLGNSGESSFVLKLGTDGSTIVYSTYLGGRNVGDITDGNAIALDSATNAYVAGDTTSFNFPTVNAFQTAMKGSLNNALSAFVGKFNTSGQPVFLTYLGGSDPTQFTTSQNSALAIAVDSSSSAYVAGQTNSKDFPVAATGTPFQAALKGPADAFVTKFNPPGTALVYSTYLGGSDDIPGVGALDAAFGIAVDSTGNAYVAGQTDSTDFPVLGAAQSANGGLLDAFVTKVNPTGTALVYSTFLGGSQIDFANGIALDGSNNAYVVGGTTSPDFKLVAPLQALLGGTRTAFVTRVNAAGAAFDYSTFLGGNSIDGAAAVAVDSTGAYVAGRTTSPNFPLQGPFQSQLLSSAGNAWVAKISPNTASAVTLFPSSFNFGPAGLGSTSFTEPFTMTNGTASSVSGITPSITGANSGDFAVVPAGTTCTSASPLAAGASCIIMVSFSPTVQDTRSANLSVAVTGAASPQPAPLTGFGAVPEVSVNPTNLNFGNQPLNIPAFRGVTATNTSSVPVHGGSLTLTGPNAGDFSVDASFCQGRTFTAGQSCFLSITFTPSASGVRSATLSISDDAADSPQIVTLTGTGVAQVIAIPSPITFFLPQIVGTTSPFAFGTTLENGSGAAITLGSSNPAAVVETGETADFPLASSTCSNGLVMAPGATCSVSLNFAPQAAGNRQATLTFNFTGAPGNPVVVNVNGVGLTGVQVLGNPFNFGNQFVGFPRNNFGTLVNGTNTALSLTSIVMGGANPNDFTVGLDPSCPSNSSLAANTTCTIDLTFTPGALGARSATATLNFSGPPGSPIVLNLSGTGVPGPIFLSTNNLAFGAQLVGQTSPPLRVVLSNDSKVADLHITGLVITPSQFTALPDSTCVLTAGSLTVKSGGNCFLDIVFAPTGAGPVTGSITFTDDGPGSPRKVTLSGTGQTPAITLSASTLDFGNETVSQISSRQTVFLINNSNAAITVTANSTFGGTNSSEFAFAQNHAPTCVANAKLLGQGGTCSVDVVFSPTAVGTRTATLTITDSGGGSPRVVNLTGVGVLTGVGSFSQAAPPTSPVTSTEVNFGSQPAGTTSAVMSATLFNIGNGPLNIVSISTTSAQNSPDFKIAAGTTCAAGTPLAVGGSCLFNLTFSPPDTSVQTPFATFTITANGGNGGPNTQLFLGMFGQVIPAGVTVTPSPLAFGSVAIGLNSFNGFRLTNGTSSTITLDTVNTVVNGPNAGEFALSGLNCSTTATTAATGAICTGNITFTPSAAGARSATLHIVYSPPAGGFVDVPLTGSGANTVVASPNPLNFSTTNVGSSGFANVTVGNGSGTNATLGAITVSGPNASEFTVTTFDCTSGNTLFAPGQCSLSVTFTPTTAGNNHTAQISLAYTGPAGSPLVINVSGNASGPTVSFSPPTTVTFGAQSVNTQSSVQLITITNTGTGFYSTTSIRLTGPNGNDFALAGGGGGCFGSGVFLSPNQACTFAVNFTPSGTGLRTGTLTFNDNAGGPHMITLNGNGQAGSVSVAPSSLDFGTQNTGTQTTLGVVLKNTLTGPTTITGISYSGANAGEFSTAKSSTCAQNLLVQGPNGLCEVDVTFSPTQVGSAIAQLTITDSVGGQHGVNLTGGGFNPSVTVTPTSLSFGNQLVGTTSNTMTVTLNNATAAAVTISPAPSTSGANATEFKILGTSTCNLNTVVVATTGSCKVDIQFTPAGINNRAATLTITDGPNDANSPHQVSLSGVGTQPGAMLSTSSINFGNVTTGVAVSQQVTLSNNGTADLNLQSIVFTGTNSGDFVPDAASTCKAGVNLTAGTGSCVLTINFTPGAPGSRTATVTFNDNASPSSQAVTLSGNGVAATATLSPNPANFPNQPKGTGSAPLAITLSNTANATLHLAASNSVKITGTNSADFAVAANGTTCTDGSSVSGPSGACTINVVFTPSTAAQETATLTVTDDASPTTQSVTLNGTGTFPQASPSSIDFGKQRQGTTSATMTMTLINAGNGTLHLAAANAVVLGGTNSTEFAILSGGGTTCVNGATVAPNGGICTVAVTFTPTQLGVQSATITFTDDASPTTQVGNLTGNGVFPQATPTPSPLDFSNQRQGVTSATKTITLTNGGTDTLHLNANNAVSLAPGSDFAIVSGAGTTCINGGTVTAGSSCTVAVTFTPTQTGARAGTITFADDASPTTQTVTLKGNGIFPQAALAPNPLDFGTQAIGFTSAAQVVKLSNNGSDALNLNAAAFSITGTNKGDFAVASGGTCANSGQVAAGSFCTINVTVKPTVQGAETATLTVTDDANPATQSTSLTATGTTATAILNPSPVSFPNTHKGNTSAAVTVTLQNIGSSSITLTAAPSIAGANQADFTIVNGAGTTCINGAMLAATNGICTVQITFTPGTATAETATLSVSDTAVPSTQTVALNGTGTFPQASASPSTLAFGNQRENTSATRSVTITNNGNETLNILSEAIIGTNMNDFVTAHGTTCRAVSTVAPNGGTCVYNVTFTPTTLTAESATLTFTTDANPAAVAVNLTGTGVFPQATPNPNPLAFGNQREITSVTKAVTITNGGTDTLHITTVTIAGSNDFTAAAGSNCANAAVAPNGGTCTYNVAFKPTTLMAEAATLTFTTDAIPSAVVVNLSGTGTFPQAVTNPTPLNFGNVLKGSTSSALPITLKNTGTDTLNLNGSNAVVVSGANQADFAVAAGTDCTNGKQVAPGNSCTINVTFKPSTTAAETATLTITDDANPNTQTVTLNGTGTNATAFLNPSPVSFANQRRGTTSAAMTVTLTNIANSTLTLASSNAVSISGANAGDFGVAAGTTCANNGNVNGSGGTCIINITFSPTTPGAETATLTVTDNATPGTQTVTLNGTGIFPAVTLSANSLTFNNQIIGTTSTAQTVTVTNSGTDTLNLAVAGSVALSGANASDFATSAGTTCANSTVLAVNASCVINITFNPGSASAEAATLTITDDVAPAQAVALSGTGVTPPTATLSPSTPINFNNQRVNAASAKQTVTVTNNGGATLNIATVALGGTDATSFAIAPSSTCTNNSSVTGGKSCTIDVTFDPTKLGALTATITLTDNANATGAPGTQQTITLNGTGVAPAVSLAPPSLQFNTQRQGTTSASQTITLTNSGTDTLNFAATNALSFTGPNAGEFAIAAGTTCANGGTVLKGANCLVKVTFTPTATGARSASLSIADDASNSPQTAAVSGTGIFPAVSLATPSITFPTTAVNSTAAAISDMLTNSGTDTLNLSASNAVVISGAGAAAFSLAAGNTCTNSLAISSSAPNNTCTLSFQFKPTAAGSFTATVTITDDVSPAQTITLNGATPATAIPSPAAVTFGNQGVATASASQGVTVSNTGGVALTFSAAPAITGPNAADFAIVANGTTCTNGANVAPGSSCTLNITFTPSAVGQRGPATLTFTDNAGGTSGATQTVSLSGMGIDFAISSTTPTAAAAGTAITAMITISPGASGFPNQVTFSATNLPPATMVAFNPPSVTPGGAPAMTQMTLTTTKRGGAAPGPQWPQVPGPLALKLLATVLLAAFTLLAMRRAARTRRWAAYLPIVALLLAATVISGCTTAAQGTPAGTYPVTVTAASGTLTHSVTVTLIVQ